MFRNDLSYAARPILPSLKVIIGHPVNDVFNVKSFGGYVGKLAKYSVGSPNCTPGARNELEHARE
ncbi:hypothetical protein GCM10010206_51690 [Streptomyces cinerochromogenes]|nr:hypothetical protein GCM10010206_51690 [Streptomyces cinerochromogenes]